MTNNAYVYAILVDGIRRYVGKGSGSRCRRHMTVVRSIARRKAVGEVVKASYFYNQLTKAWLAGAEIDEIILTEELTHEEAYAHEIAEIASAPNGQLWNFWAGGEGSSKGHAKSADEIARIAAINRKTWTDPKLLAEHSERCKVTWLRPEYRKLTMENARKGRDAEFSACMSKNATERWADPKFRAKMKDVFSSPEYLARRSAATKRGWEKRRAKQQ